LILKKKTPAKQMFSLFYPTLGNSFTDSLGNPMLYPDKLKTAERDAAQGNQRFNKAVYAGEDFNLFASFYRQNTMEVYPANQLNFQ